MRQDAAAAHPHHLRASRGDRAGRARDVEQELGMRDIADIDDRGAVGLDLAGQRVLQIAAEIAEIEDVPPVLVDDQRLVDRPALIIGRALDLHVPDRFLVPRLGCWWLG